MKIGSHWIAAGLLLVGSAAIANEYGLRDYMQNCSVCHGVFGKGNAVASSLLVVPVPDLTTISARNGGAFPFQDVMATIDGRGIRGHGPMPVWGWEMQNDKPAVAGTETGEMILEMRVENIVEFLETLQE